jgi:hypothetical protein
MNADDYTTVAIRETLPNRTFNKVFGIGFNKTGTTSLEAIFKLLGFRVPVQTEQELRIVKQLYNGNFRPLIEWVNQHDAFQDMPFSQGECYAQVDALFPGSKFILTIRDSEDWFESLCRFHVKIWGVSSVHELDQEFFKDKDPYLYTNYVHDSFERLVTVVKDRRPVTDWSLLYNREHFIEVYTRRNDRIISYFRSRPNDLLVIDFQKEQDIGKILEFFNYTRKLNIPLPHENSS